MDMAKTVALTAVGGLVVGLVGCGSSDAKDSSTPAAGTEAAPSASQTGAKTCCKGLNSCEGKGGCHVEGKQACKGQNKCHGQGGCKSRTDC